MKKITTILFLLIVLALNSCLQDSDKNSAVSKGTLAIEFSHYVGSKELKLTATPSDSFPYTTSLGQKFNVSLFGYYVTQVALKGSQGNLWEDRVHTSVKADSVSGIYQVLETDSKSKSLSFSDVAPGSYDTLILTIGIPESIVSEGAQGGILDVAKGAWFWNWNSGYIGMAIEGQAENSPFVAKPGLPDKAFQLHIGGWKDVTPPEGEVKKLSNNVRTLRLPIGRTITVSADHTPELHIVMDLLKILNGSEADFTTLYQLHSPAAGTKLADQFGKAFVVDHVH